MKRNVEHKDPKTCHHKMDVMVEVVLRYEPQPSIGGTVYTVVIRCLNCNTRLKGQVQAQ